MVLNTFRTTIRIGLNAKNKCSLDNVFLFRIPVPPSAPVVNVATAGPTWIQLQWSVADNGGSAVRGYVVNYKQQEPAEWEERSASRDATTYKLTGLTCGLDYHVQVMYRLTKFIGFFLLLVFSKKSVDLSSKYPEGLSWWSIIFTDEVQTVWFFTSFFFLFFPLFYVCFFSCFLFTLFPVVLHSMGRWQHNLKAGRQNYYELNCLSETGTWFINKLSKHLSNYILYDLHPLYQVRRFIYRPHLLPSFNHYSDYPSKLI